MMVSLIAVSVLSVRVLMTVVARKGHTRVWEKKREKL
jgi:hypothetical protein